MSQYIPPPEQPQPDVLVPPMPGIASPARKDSIDPESADAKSIAPSNGTGLCGKVQAANPPPHDDTGEHSWMQDA